MGNLRSLTTDEVPGSKYHAFTGGKGDANRMERQKRVLAIHDISGVGKCSLTVALPIVSAAGVECSVLPTAVLSTHTGGFTGFTYRDLTEDISPIITHWQSLHLKFDGIYTGFLGSFEQIQLVGDAFSALADKDTLLVVDPVMADGGKLYTIFDDTFPPAMKGLCSKADVILPNMTEAAFMLGEEYQEGPYTHDYVEGLLHRLVKEIPVQGIVLTGVYFDEKELGAAVYDVGKGNIHYVLGRNIPGSYHGTGDVFGSAFVGAAVSGKDMVSAARIAVDYTVECIAWTKEAGTDIRYGVNFERYLGDYSRKLGL